MSILADKTEDILDDDPTLRAKIDGLLGAHGIDELKFDVEILIAFIYNVSRMLVEKVLNLKYRTR